MESNEIKRSKRDTPPADYILKIKSFSQLSEILKETGDGKYMSDEFEAAHYKWKLVLYPNGNAKRNGKGHISLYLASTDKRTVSSGCNINVLVSFFIYDHIRDNYLTIQDAKIKRYNILRTEHGFDKLLPLAKLNDPASGYVDDDCCLFGVEVHVIKSTVKADEFSLIKNPPDGTFTWKIDNFSKLGNIEYYSEVFTVAGRKWNLLLYPRGELEEKDRCLSLYLCLEEKDRYLSFNYGLDANPGKSQVYVEYKLLVKDQINGIHHEVEDSGWFEKWDSWGFQCFMVLEELDDASKGFLVNDSLVIEVKITQLSVSQDLI